MNESNLSRDASGMKSNRIRVFTVFKSIQLAYRIFISYRIQIISMPVSCRRDNEFGKRNNFMPGSFRTGIV